MSRKICIQAIILLSILINTPELKSTETKDSDAGLWINASLAPKPLAGKWKTVYALEYRSKENFRTTDLWCGTVRVNYITNSHLLLGAGYELFLNRQPDGKFTPEYRYYPEGILSYQWEPFSAALRFRVMNTYTEWRHPDFESRNRLKLSYTIRNSTLKPFVYVEPYHKIRKEAFSYHKIRYAAGCSFRFDRQQIDVLYMREIYHRKPFTRNVIEIDYQYSF